MSHQTWNAETYAQNARFVPELAEAVVQLLAPQPGDILLDIGCGDGYLTARLAEKVARVTGVDSSVSLVEAARKIGLDIRLLDARRIGGVPEFLGAFDAVFSNATLHWIQDPDTVIAAVSRVLKPGGRFVGEFGGEGCVARIRWALDEALARRGFHFADLNPWYFPSASEYRDRLEANGFIVDYCEVIPRPTALPGEVKGWLETFALTFTSVLPSEQRDDFLEEVQALLKPYLCDSEGRWTADYTRLRFRAKLAQGFEAREGLLRPSVIGI